MTDIAKYAATLSLALLCLPAYSSFQGSDVAYLSPLRKAQVEQQKGWLDTLKNEVQMSRPKLLDMMETKPAVFFAKSCTAPLIPGDYERLRTAFADIMLSSAATADQPRGRLLACMQNSGLESLKANIDLAFFKQMKPSEPVAPLVSCRWIPTVVGAETSERRILWYHPSDGESRKGHSNFSFGRVPMTFENVALHEMVHVGGVSSEDTVTTIVGCCGQHSEFREEACKALDATVAKDRTVLYFDRKIAGYTILKNQAYELDYTNILVLGRKFYDVMIERLGGAKAAENSNENILAAAKFSLDAVFPSQCQVIVSGKGNKEACNKVDASVKEKMLGYMKAMLARP